MSDTAPTHLGRGTLVTMLAKGLEMVVNLGALVLLPRLLKPEGFGVYTYWFSLWVVQQTFLELSAGSLLTRYIPIWKEKQPEQLHRLWRGLFSTKVLLIPVVVLLSKGDHPWGPVLCVAAAAFLFSWAGLYAALLYGLEHMLRYCLYSTLGTLFRVVAVLAIFYVAGARFIPAALLACSAALWLVFIWFTRDCRHILHRSTLTLPSPGAPGEGRVRVWPPLIPWREYWEFGLWVYAGQFAVSLLNRLPVLYAKPELFSQEEVGFLGLAVSSCIAMRAIPLSASQAFLPRLVGLAAEEDHGRFQQVQQAGWRFTNIILFLMVTALYCLAPAFFPLILGAKYGPYMEQIIRLVRLVLPAIVLSSASLFHQNLLFAKGRSRAYFWTSLAALAAMLAILEAPWLHPSLTIAVLALDLGFLVHYLATVAFTKTFPGYFPPLLACVLGSAATGGVFYLVPIADWTSLVWFFTLPCAAYFLVLLLFRQVTGEDWKRVRESVARLF